MATTILGISPGTRIIGIAVMRNGELIDYQVKCFKERWTKAKQKSILSYISSVMKYYEVTTVAIKSHDPARSSHQIEHLIEELKKVAERRQATFHAYANVTVRLGLGIKGTNKRALFAYIAELYPELRRIYLKEINNLHGYYEKMFEAIIVAKWCEIENQS